MSVKIKSLTWTETNPGLQYRADWKGIRYHAIYYPTKKWIVHHFTSPEGSKKIGEAWTLDRAKLIAQEHFNDLIRYWIDPDPEPEKVSESKLGS
jgi:hypothetical protein